MTQSDEMQNRGEDIQESFQKHRVLSLACIVVVVRAITQQHQNTSKYCHFEPCLARLQKPILVILKNVLMAGVPISIHPV